MSSELARAGFPKHPLSTQIRFTPRTYTETDLIAVLRQLMGHTVQRLFTRMECQSSDGCCCFSLSAFACPCLSQLIIALSSCLSLFLFIFSPPSSLPRSQWRVSGCWQMQSVGFPLASAVISLPLWKICGDTGVSWVYGNMSYSLCTSAQNKICNECL